MEKNGNGHTTLHCACRSSNPSINVVKRLLEVEGREMVMEKDIYGNTALVFHCAYQSDNPSIDLIKKLIKVGGRDLVVVQRENNRKCHPLLHTFYARSIEYIAVKTLIEEGLCLSFGGEFGIGGLFNCCTPI